MCIKDEMPTIAGGHSFVFLYKLLVQMFALLTHSFLEVVLLDILEVVYGTYLELYGSSIVAYDDAVGVELEYADGPHLSDGTLNCVVESLSLVVAVSEDKHLLGIHYGTYAYGYSGLGHLVHIVVKET